MNLLRLLFKGKPKIEQRFEQVKTVHEIAPVFLNDKGRIESFIGLYLLALLIQSIIERERRPAVAGRQEIQSI